MLLNLCQMAAQDNISPLKPCPIIARDNKRIKQKQTIKSQEIKAEVKVSGELVVRAHWTLKADVHDKDEQTKE